MRFRVASGHPRWHATAREQEDATDRSDHAGDLLDGSGPPPGPVTIEVVSDTAAVVTLEGDHDVASRGAIADAFNVAATGRDLLVDLTECTFIDSTIIKLLLQTMRALEEKDGRLEIVIDVDSHGHVARVAELMGIADVIPTHGSRSDGIRSLAGPGGAPSRYV
jgi:anti-sigma B factor antagonist